MDLVKMNTMDKFAAKLNKATPKSASSSFWLQPIPNGRRTPMDWNKVANRAAAILQEKRDRLEKQKKAFEDRKLQKERQKEEKKKQ